MIYRHFVSNIILICKAQVKYEIILAHENFSFTSHEAPSLHTKIALFLNLMQWKVENLYDLFFF
jgi:hypothetical protein